MNFLDLLHCLAPLPCAHPAIVPSPSGGLQQAVAGGGHSCRNVRVRELAATHQDLAKRLAELEVKTEGLALSHDTFSRNTRMQLKQVFDAIRELMTPPTPPKRPIGFVTPEDKKDMPKGSTVGRGKKT